MHKHTILVGLVACCGLAPDAAIAGDCRLIGKVMHCFSPPPAQVLSLEQHKQIQDRFIAQTRRIMSPMAQRGSAASCTSARASAAAEARYDLVLTLTKSCGTLIEGGAK